MLQKLYKRLEQTAAERPVLLAFWVFLGATAVVLPLSLPFYIYETQEMWMNVLAEAHGMVFDLLIIGWFLLWLNRMAQKRIRNGRYREEIEDFLGWKSPEATHRIVGSIRRLNRGGVREKFRLTEAYLVGAKLGGAHLRESDLWGASLEGASLRDADLTGANLAGAVLDGADLERAILRNADMRGCSLRESDLERAELDGVDLRGAMLPAADMQYASLKHANLSRTKLPDANLRGADLEGANLNGSSLLGANLRGALLTGADLRGARLNDADFLGANLENAVLPEDEETLIALFEPVKTLFGAHLSPEIEKTLFKARPGLLEIAHDTRPRPRPTRRSEPDEEPALP